MTSTHRNLSALVNLAKEPSSEKRRELLHQMTDLFMEAPASYQDREREQFGDILGTVAREMETAVRQKLAHRLSSEPGAPRNLILQLASDDISVARPVLLNSVTLTDSDLVALAKLKSQDHLRAIAGRETVSTTVSDALVARGDDTVLESLVSNAGAAISRESMEHIVDRAETVESLRRPVVSRTDLPPDLLQGMFFTVSSELKRVIMQRMSSLDPAMIDDAIRQVERRMKVTKTSVDSDQKRAEATILELRKAGPITEGLLVTLAKQKRHDEAAAVFASLAALEIKVVRRLLTDPNPEGLAIAARACRFDRQSFSSMVLNRDGDTRAASDAMSLLQLYDQVPVEAAQRVMRFWRVRQTTSQQTTAA